MNFGKYYFQISIKNPISKVRFERIKKIYNKKNHGIQIGVIKTSTDMWKVSGDWDALTSMCRSMSKHLPDNELHFWTCSGNFYFVGYDVYAGGIGPDQNIYSYLDGGIEGPFESTLRPKFFLGSISPIYDLTPWLEDIESEIIERNLSAILDDTEEKEELKEWSSESDD
jgi:hypothetical protein